MLHPDSQYFSFKSLQFQQSFCTRKNLTFLGDFTHFRASMVKMLIAGQEILQSNICSKCFSKHFLHSLAVYFSCLPGNISWHQQVRSKLAFPQQRCSLRTVSWMKTILPSSVTLLAHYISTHGPGTPSWGLPQQEDQSWRELGILPDTFFLGGHWVMSSRWRDV